MGIEGVCFLDSLMNGMYNFEAYYNENAAVFAISGNAGESTVFSMIEAARPG